MLSFSEAELRDEPFGLTHQELTLAYRLPREPDLGITKVAQAAVHQLRRAARGPRREVARLEKKRA
jgi:hypothetical protein